MRRGSIEWPTLWVAAVIGLGFATVLLLHHRLPVPLVVALLAVLGSWYNSLQHEVVHGHPTRWQRLNTVFAIIPLGLVVPFAAYRTSHLAHHRTEQLTNPDIDPESFYVTTETWERAGRLRRGLLTVMMTLAGRLVLGPPVAAAQWWWRTVTSMREWSSVRTVAGHIIGVVAVLAVVGAAGIPIWVYIVGVAWGGGALTLLRSFAEHRLPDDGTRCGFVRSNWFFSLLFLNNNLHHTHHTRPGLAWYDLPRASEDLGSAALAAQGAGLYRGYTEIARRFLLRPFDTPAV